MLGYILIELSKVVLVLVVHGLEVILNNIELGLLGKALLAVVHGSDDVLNRLLVLQGVVNQVPVVKHKLQVILYLHLLGYQSPLRKGILHYGNQHVHQDYEDV